MFLRGLKAGIIPLRVRLHVILVQFELLIRINTVILAVSTTAPNPLQAITALHSRNLEFPPWVDPTFLRYTLIIHPQNSPLSDEEYVPWLALTPPSISFILL